MSAWRADARAPDRQRAHRSRRRVHASGGVLRPGLHGIGSTSVVADNPATRGMIRQVRFLVTVEEIADAADTRSGKPSKGRSKDEGDAAASRTSEDSKEKTKA